MSLGVANTAEDTGAVRAWYRVLLEQGTLGRMVATELVDLVWVAGAAAVALLGTVLAARLLGRRDSWGGRLLRRLAPWTALAPGLDLVENALSLTMLADPLGFPAAPAPPRGGRTGCEIVDAASDPWARGGGVPERSAFHHGSLPQVLIEVSLDLIAEHGLDGFSLATAAKAAGVSVAAPYRHFANKAALLGAIARTGLEQLGAVLRAADARYPNDPVEALLEQGVAYIGFVIDHPGNDHMNYIGGLTLRADLAAVVRGTLLPHSRVPRGAR